jgi:hypothetical protein
VATNDEEAISVSAAALFHRAVVKVATIKNAATGQATFPQ